jgi:hypothetical protein
MSMSYEVRELQHAVRTLFLSLLRVRVRLIATAGDVLRHLFQRRAEHRDLFANSRSALSMRVVRGHVGQAPKASRLMPPKRLCDATRPK